MANGGIIGPINVTSRGKNTITAKTCSGTVTTQPGTRLVRTVVVAGGGGGGSGPTPADTGFSGGGAVGLGGGSGLGRGGPPRHMASSPVRC